MSVLSKSDVSRLVAEPSAPARADLAAKIALEIDNPGLGPREVEIAGDIVRLLASDIETTVRENLSRGLRHSSRLPYDVAVRLANDIEKVALPILADSTVLTASDLVDIVRSGSPVRQTVIAGRRDLAETVADELITVGHAAAVSTLMRNPTARISEGGFGRAIERFSGDDAVKESMVRREALPITIAERLVTLVSDNLKSYLVTHHRLPAHIAVDIVSQTQDVTTIYLSDGCNDDELAHLVAEMNHHGRLTPFLVLRALCMGDMAFFEVAMAAMANVPVANARRLIRDAGPGGLRSLFERSHLPASLLPAMRVAVDVAKQVGIDEAERDPERYRVRVVTRVLAEFEKFGARDSDYLLDKLIAVLTFVSGRYCVTA